MTTQTEHDAAMAYTDAKRLRTIFCDGCGELVGFGEQYTVVRCYECIVADASRSPLESAA